MWWWASTQVYGAEGSTLDFQSSLLDFSLRAIQADKLKKETRKKDVTKNGLPIKYLLFMHACWEQRHDRNLKSFFIPFSVLSQISFKTLARIKKNI